MSHPNKVIGPCGSTDLREGTNTNPNPNRNTTTNANLNANEMSEWNEVVEVFNIEKDMAEPNKVTGPLGSTDLRGKLGTKKKPRPYSSRSSTRMEKDMETIVANTAPRSHDRGEPITQSKVGGLLQA